MQRDMPETYLDKGSKRFRVSDYVRCIGDSNKYVREKIEKSRKYLDEPYLGFVNMCEYSLYCLVGNKVHAHIVARGWIKFLYLSFLIKADNNTTKTKRDFEILCYESKGTCVVQLRLHSPCAKYCWWRIVNNQTPETVRRMNEVAYKLKGFPSRNSFVKTSPRMFKPISAYDF